MSAEKIESFKRQYDQAVTEIRRVIVGHDTAVDLLMAAFLSGGHVLLEGVPGLGKTLLAASFAHVLGLDFKKIQFTPDLMPADITGTNVIREEDGGRKFVFQEGPLFTNIVLADEINRATPKTQSALLEGMQERCVTTGNETRPLPVPFMVVATQNPVEMKGTYPLPEAQKDRFMFKADLRSDGRAGMAEVLRRTTGARPPAAEKMLDPEAIRQMIAMTVDVAVAAPIHDLVAGIIMLTDPAHPDAPAMVQRYVRLGSSVRGGQAIIAGAKADALCSGRVNAAVESIGKFIAPALRHRLILNFEAGADGITADAVLAEVARAAGV